MGVTTFEAIVENGQIRLPINVRLPEKAKVYVVVPGVEVTPIAYLASPRLVHREQADDFKMRMLEEDQDAGV